MSLHESFMQRALALARRGEGLTRPNPPVGALLVQNGKIIAEGFHKKAGGPHAEVNCLRTVPAIGQSAVLYVTLEPCSTQGRTPPCTDLILERGIRHVVIGTKDPNPVHAGRGIRLLRRAGVDVITGVCRAEAEALIAPFAKRILTGMPYVTLKLAITIDGRIADESGKSRWITGPQARSKVQELRRSADAVLVGAGTVRMDNPSLLPRPARGRSPWRIVVGTDVPPESRVLTDEAADRTLVMNDSLEKIMRDLGNRGFLHVLCEGGGELAGSLVRAGLVDRFMFFMAPSILGGGGVPMFGKKSWRLADMPRLNFQTLERCGKDVLITAGPVREE